MFDRGTTVCEAAGHEDLDHCLARGLPDLTDDSEGDGLGDTSDTAGELYDDQVGTTRDGRLVEDEELDPVHPDLSGPDVGVDGAAASAEEAAVHIVPE